MFGGFGQQPQSQQPQQPPQLGLTSTSGALVPFGASAPAQPTLGFGVGSGATAANPAASLFGARPNTGPLFGSAAASPFGATPATSTGTAPSLFGAPAATVAATPAGTGSLFGAPSTAPGTSLFGSQPATSSIFGSQPQQRPGSLFGGDGSTATAQQQVSNGSLFGTPSTLFGSGAGMASTLSAPLTGTLSFGSAAAQPPVSGFGSTNTNTSTSTSTNAFGSAFAANPSATPSLNTGTGSPPFTTTSDTDGTTTTILHSITAMPAYRSKSLEELRLEDYAKGKKTPGYGPPGMATSSQPQPAASSIFGQSTPNPFAFGGQPQPQSGQLSGGLFSSAQPSQQATTGFGFGAGAAPSQPAPASIFGSVQPSATSGFGSSFGAPQPQTANPFGSTTPAAAASSGLFPSSAQQAQSTLGAFGQPAQTAASTAFTNPFGATQQTLGTGFGAGAAPLFGSKPAAVAVPSAAGSPFGSGTSAPSSLFGGSTASSFLAPTPTAQGAVPTNPFGSTTTPLTAGLFGQSQPPAPAVFGAAPTASTSTGASQLGGGFKSPYSAFGTTTAATTPFGQPASTGLAGVNPFAMTQQTAANPFGTTGASTNPFAAPSTAGSTTAGIAAAPSALSFGTPGAAANPFAASTLMLPSIAPTAGPGSGAAAGTAVPGFSLGSGGASTAPGSSFGWGSVGAGASAATAASAPLTPFTMPFAQSAALPGAQSALAAPATGSGGWPSGLASSIWGSSQLPLQQQQQMPGAGGQQTAVASVSDRKSYGTHPWLDAPSAIAPVTPARPLAGSSLGSPVAKSPAWRGTYSIGGLTAASVGPAVASSLANASASLLRGSRPLTSGPVGGALTAHAHSGLHVAANGHVGLTVRRSNRKLIIEPKNRLFPPAHHDGHASAPVLEPLSYRASGSFRGASEPTRPSDATPRYLGSSLRVASDDDLGDGYYCSPSSMILYESALRGSPVEFFKIGKTGAGLIEYSVPIQLSSLLESGFDKDLFVKRLKSLVVFDRLTVAVYPELVSDDSAGDEGNDPTGRPRLKKPPVGSGLNNPAIVSVESCRPIQRGASEGAPPDIQVIKIFIERLKHVPDTQFLEYKIDAAVWVFKAEHF